jgi:signal transduction histidine kinase
VAQVLGYVNTKAQAAEVLLQNGQQDRALAQINQLGQAARDAYADVREHILGLRVAGDASREFVATLRAYLETWQEQSGITVTLVTEPETSFDADLPETGELQLLRIIQEALANVRKHAGAKVATVHLTDREGWVEATIEDNGSGFDPDASNRSAIPRFGLTTMRERAEAVGGMLEIETVIGSGTRVTTRIPKANSRTLRQRTPVTADRRTG